MSEQDESEVDRVGTRWGNKCPQCDHVETRDYGPGRYPSADRCPECNWPMNCVDLDVVDQEPKRELVTDGGRDIDFDEPPEIPDPPMYPEWEDVETWSKANLRYPVPGGWEIADHGKFHTTWEHEDGTELTRSSKRTPGQKDTFAFSVDGEEIHSVDAGPERVEMREETVWLLQFYDENGIESVEEFEVEVRKERNQSLDEFATDGGVDQSEAAVERDRKSIDELTQEEKDTLVSELMREPQTSVAVVSAVRKIDDIEAGPGELPESLDIGCQKCNEPIEEGDEYTTAFGYYYCKPCHERAQEALKTAEDVDGGEA